MPALSESFFLFKSHDNSIRSSRERHRFIAVQYNIYKQRLTKIKHDNKKTTLQRIIFIDNNLNNKLLLLLLFHYQKYLPFDSIIFSNVNSGSSKIGGTLLVIAFSGISSPQKVSSFSLNEFTFLMNNARLRLLETKVIIR